MKVAFQNFQAEAKARGNLYLEAMSRVMHSGWYVLGPEVEAFEREFSEYLGTSTTIGVANGLEAIQIALMALDVGPGDEVITTPLSAVATTLAIKAVGASPVFADTDANGLLDPKKVEVLITHKTKAIIPVHLYGNTLDVAAYQRICRKYKLFLIEDAAQAHGAEFQGKKVGTFGQFGCWSFYPTKNLGAIGDAGALVTDDPVLAERARKIRNYGQSEKYLHSEYGLNSRLDELQAAVLRVKLKFLVEDIAERNRISDLYQNGIIHPGVHPLSLISGTKSARHLFVVRTTQRRELQEHLEAAGVAALIHYPLLIPDQPLFGQKYDDLEIPQSRMLSKEILSLPIHPFLEDEEIIHTINTINSFSNC